MFYSALRGSSVKNVLEMTAYFFPSMWLLKRVSLSVTESNRSSFRCISGTTDFKGYQTGQNITVPRGEIWIFQFKKKYTTKKKHKGFFFIRQQHQIS